jgi:hypothetical protein
MDMNVVKELLKKAFELDELQEETYLESFFAGRGKKYLIPEDKLNAVLKDFPFMKNTLKAGLISKDKRKGGYFTTEKILSVKSTDKRKSRAKQFFSINGDDHYERTTLYDSIVTLNNLKYISKKFGLGSDEIKFTIRYENGNPEKVMNYIELDKRIFGSSEQEIEKNVKQINELVKYKKSPMNEEKISV